MAAETGSAPSSELAPPKPSQLDSITTEIVDESPSNGIGESGELLASIDSPLAEVPSSALHAGLDYLLLHMMCRSNGGLS